MRGTRARRGTYHVRFGHLSRLGSLFKLPLAPLGLRHLLTPRALALVHHRLGPAAESNAVRVAAAESDSVASSAGITSVPAVVAQQAGASDSPVQHRHAPLRAPSPPRAGLRAARLCSRSTEAHFRYVEKMSVDFLHPNVLAFFSTSSIVTILGFRNPKKKKRWRAIFSRRLSREEGGRRDREAEAGGRRESRSIRT